MNRKKLVIGLLAAASMMPAEKLWADEAANAQAAQAAPAAKAAVPAKAANAQSSSSASMKEANALAAAGKTAEAIQAYEKIGVLKSKKAEGWRLNNEGLAYLIASEPAPEKAIPLLEKATATDANNAVAWNNLGSAYVQTEQLDKAKNAFEKSIEAAKTAGASSEKAEANLQELQARLDKRDSAKGNADEEKEDESDNQKSASAKGTK
jgi:tetratricopeptide (TPR) repeat protein